MALCLRNDFPFFEASLGANQVGAYPFAMNWHCTEPEARYLFENCGARLIVIHVDLLPGVRAAIPAEATVLVVPTPPEIVAAYGLSDDGEAGQGYEDWNAWCERHAPHPQEPPKAPSTIVYTSGTTGHPKGVKRLPATLEQTQSVFKIVFRAFGLGGSDAASLVPVLTGPLYHSAPNM